MFESDDNTDDLSKIQVLNYLKRSADKRNELSED